MKIKLALLRLGIISLMAVMIAGCGSSKPVNESEGSSGNQHWVNSWMAAISGAEAPGFAAQSMRMIINPHFSGKVIRLHFSNLYGALPVTLSSINIAQSSSGAKLLVGSLTPVKFNGLHSVTLNPGQAATSDEAEFTVTEFENAAVSFHIEGATGPATAHQVASQTSYYSDSGAGDHANDENGDAFTNTKTSWYFLTGLDVMAVSDANSVVTFGDSLTDGVNVLGGKGYVDQNARWPDVLARRLAANSAYKNLSVSNSGISGNRVLTDAPLGPLDPTLAGGPSGLSRFARDALDISGVCTIIVVEGFNDIGIPILGVPPPPLPFVTADELIAGYRQFIAQAHAKGLNILGATLTPSTFLFHGEPLGTGVREAVNTWIRNSGEWDGVIDFDAVVRDPNNHKQLLAAYDGGDALHMTKAGYEAMGNAIDLGLLRCQR